MMQSVEDISSELLNQLRRKAKGFESFFSALDKSNDVSNTAHLLSLEP
jgi:hypothetical protein